MLSAASRRTRTIAIAGSLFLLLNAAGALARNAAFDPGASKPFPVVAPGRISGDFPENSHVASCWVIANVGHSLQAPRSQRAAEVVGPLYEDACLGA